MLKKIIFTYTPLPIIKYAQRVNKNLRRIKLHYHMKFKNGIDEQQLVDEFKRIGLTAGDSVLIHCSFSKIGYVKGGPKTVIDALMQVVGNAGTILCPAFPATGSNQRYLQTNPVFDRTHTPSKTGILTEYFRTLPTVRRSFHPTDSVAAWGALAEYYTNTHFGQLTPYNEHSPFYKLRIKGGKILMIGTNACSTLHTLEDNIPNFKYKAYNDEVIDAKMIDYDGKETSMKTKTHHPDYTSSRNIHELIPFLKKENGLIAARIGAANSFLIDADKMCRLAEQLYYQSDFIPFGNKFRLNRL